MTRDFVGYGPTPPHANWPGGARIAVNFVINFEEGSEPSWEIDGFSEGGLTESALVPASAPTGRRRKTRAGDCRGQHAHAATASGDALPTWRCPR